MAGRTIKFCALALLTAVSVGATAQVVVQAETAILQPQIGRDEQGFNVCGVRAVVMDTVGKNVEAYDFTLTIRANLYVGLLKAGKSRISSADMMAGKQTQKVVVPAPVKFWIAAASEDKAVTPQKVVASKETPGFILETADLVATHSAILSMIRGEQMQFVVRYPDQKLDRVIAFAAKMPDNEVGPLNRCLDGLTNRMTTEAD